MAQMEQKCHPDRRQMEQRCHPDRRQMEHMPLNARQMEHMPLNARQVQPCTAPYYTLRVHPSYYTLRVHPSTTAPSTPVTATPSAHRLPQQR